MERINFEVGAKAARLIGRENITDVKMRMMQTRLVYVSGLICPFRMFQLKYLHINCSKF